MTSISMEYLSGAMTRVVRVQILLPHEGMHPERSVIPPWKTLYFLPGMTENAYTIHHNIQLPAMVQEHGIAVVIPDGENSYYVNNEKRNARYEDYAGEELVRETRKLFPLSQRREDTWIGGISMGGFGAMMIGARHRDIFSKIAALSPAIHPYEMVDQQVMPEALMEDVFGSRAAYLREYDPANLLIAMRDRQQTIPDIFIRCGTEDRLTYQVCHKFSQQMTERGIPLDYAEAPGEHNHWFWNRQLQDMMKFLKK